MNSNDLCHRSGGERLGALTAGLEAIGTTAATRRVGTSARRPLALALASASAHQNDDRNSAGSNRRSFLCGGRGSDRNLACPFGVRGSSSGATTGS